MGGAKNGAAKHVETIAVKNKTNVFMKAAMTSVPKGKNGTT
jgi:hypothetical protein